MTNPITAMSARTVLRLDGGMCLLMSVLLIALQTDLGMLTGLPSTFLFGAGALLLPIGLFILLLTLPEHPHRLGMLVVVAGNAMWVLASIGVVVAGIVDPNLVGLALVLGQAIAVALITALEATFLAPIRAAA